MNLDRIDRLLDSLVRFTTALRWYFWQRFLLLGWIGRAVAIIVTLYGAGWIIGSLGIHDLARQLGSAAIFALSVLLATLFIRWVWRSYTGPHP